ncbi:MAG: indole-3-glycerol phosphate synthase TrpC [Dehalococcoidia bacterium]|nr:indole-3-glycerol phosphate synthase TrpC [Dehalococcoidia bacterium]
MTQGRVLDQIIEYTGESIAIRKQLKPAETLKRELINVSQPKNFPEALQHNGLNLIAEIKMASPSRGVFPLRLSVTELAIIYASAGASAISVVTESRYFRGSLSYLTTVRSTVDLPLLCKDFIIDPYQVYEARLYGADAVLLIASILGSSKLQELCKITSDLGMAPLVEVHNIRDVEKALAAPTKLIGINNRDLTTFKVSLETTLRLRPLIPAGIIVVSESGIRSNEDVELLKRAGVHAILVGESLVTSPNPASKLAELMGKRECANTSNPTSADCFRCE